MYFAVITRFNLQHSVKCLQFSLLNKSFYVSATIANTHDYQAKEYTVLSENLKLKPVQRISGAFVRFRDSDEMSDEPNAKKVLVIGTHKQCDRALKALEMLDNGHSVDVPKKATLNVEAEERLIWHGYRRNFKGQYAPKPRKQCIRCGGKMLSGNPCPLCQMKLSFDYDVHYQDVMVLNHFICPHTWNMLDASLTGICRKQQRAIEAAVRKARLYGYIPFTLPQPSDTPQKHKPAGVPTDRKIKVKMH